MKAPDCVLSYVGHISTVGGVFEKQNCKKMQIILDRKKKIL